MKTDYANNAPLIRPRRSWPRRMVRVAMWIVIIVCVAELFMRGAGWLMLHVWREKYPASGQVRILCLGDSYTYGVGAKRGYSYPRQLQTLLDETSKCKVQVINRGVPGMNSDYIRAHFKESLLKYRPHVVLFLAGINNHWNATDAYTAAENPTVAEQFQSFAYEFRLVKLIQFTRYRLKYRWVNHRDPLSGIQDYEIKRSIYEDGANLAKGHVVREQGRERTIHYDIHVRSFESEEASTRLVRDVGIMNGLARKYDVAFIVMTYPNPMPIHPALVQYVEAEGIPLIDHKSFFYSKIPKDKLSEYYYEENFIRSHPNEKGYGAMADLILKSLPRYCGASKSCFNGK